MGCGGFMVVVVGYGVVGVVKVIVVVWCFRLYLLVIMVAWLVVVMVVVVVWLLVVIVVGSGW